ncbi:cytochrome P450 [Thermomonospora catenispora]|uniref:cytochrome P450 n=1 Tax=Thermomonospora catenispora TaxID=2493090 RepID=UPI001124A4F4|nr:cytochrome P450 [Thermomonospora catenispora]TNY38161.1 cytochrome P450 [Thermomonospora catenispora]
MTTTDDALARREGGDDADVLPLPASYDFDIDPLYDELRKSRPVAKVTVPGQDTPAWLVTRHADVRHVLSDPRFSRAAAVDHSPGRRTMVYLVDMDPPEHTRLRRVVHHAFSPRQVERLRPWVRGLVSELIDAMVAHDPPADLISRLTMPLPVTIVGELFGVPAEDRPAFSAWAQAFTTLTGHTAEEVAQAQQSMYAYLARLLLGSSARTDRAGDSDGPGDVAGALLRAHRDGVIDEQEMINLAMIILVAGYETTVNVLGGIVYTLLRRPGLWADFRDRARDPRAVATAVEELLRVVPVGTLPPAPRVATEDTVVSGQPIKAGDAVFVAHETSAAHDPEIFEAPEEIRLDRTPNPHLTFGHGPHFCLGAHLARLEIQEVLTALAHRLPGLRLAVPEEELQWVRGGLVRGLRALPVTWT